MLATKVYGTMGDWPNEARLSALAHPQGVRGVAASGCGPTTSTCTRCTTSTATRRWDEIWEAFEQLKRQGKIIYVGSSNFAGWHIARANEIATWRHFLGLASEQSLYNLTARTIELEVIPACQEYGMGLIPWSPLAGGLLAGALEKVEKGWRRSQEYMAGEIEEHRAKLVKWEALCDELGERPSDVALAWLLHQPVVTAPIIGPRTEEQLLSNLHALEIELSGEVLDKLDEIFPGPGGTAPEAYAW